MRSICGRVTDDDPLLLIPGADIVLLAELL